MRPDQVPKPVRSYLIPSPHGEMYYECLSCSGRHDIKKLLYTCPNCGGVLLLKHEGSLEIGPQAYQQTLDFRKVVDIYALKGIFRYYEFIAPVIPIDHIVYLGEGSTPMVEVNKRLRDVLRRDAYFKLDGLNPSASFKDRGMACALSYINYLLRTGAVENILAICASTGDTSAAAALYSSFIPEGVTSVVLLPKGKVTPQQLAQPLGHGAKVLEIPGLFDHCMKVVEYLAERYQVALLNSKNSWRILGQESYSYEIAQDLNWELEKKVVVVPIGNAGNITAVLSGFLKFFKRGIIKELPKVIGVQSEHADPVFRYYQAPKGKREFKAVEVRPSVAQAAMIGNPVSMPRVIRLVEEYERLSGGGHFYVVNVREQEIIDSMLYANRNGNAVCTQGGESLAGFRRAIELGLVEKEEVGILDSTAHMLKFISFQEMYFEDRFDPEYEIRPKEELKNFPIEVTTKNFMTPPSPDRVGQFVEEIGSRVAEILGLEAL